jgi:hypothetical protein
MPAGQKLLQSINKVNEAQPKSMVSTILFLQPKEESGEIRHCPQRSKWLRYSFGNKLEFDNEKGRQDNYFQTSSRHGGFVNFVGEKQGVIRYFSPFEKWKDSVNSSFAACSVQVSDELKF